MQPVQAATTVTEESTVDEIKSKNTHERDQQMIPFRNLVSSGVGCVLSTGDALYERLRLFLSRFCNFVTDVILTATDGHKKSIPKTRIVKEQKVGIKVQLKESESLWDRSTKWLREPEFMVPERVDEKKKSIHQYADSLFSTSSGFTDYRGLLNLCIVLLVLSNARVALENIIKYGILIDPVSLVQVIWMDPYSWPCLLLTLSSALFVIAALMIERLLQKEFISEGFGSQLHCINLIITIMYPAIAIYIIHPKPVFSSITLAIYTVIFLKLISYKQVNMWCRADLKGTTAKRRRNKTLGTEALIEASMCNGTGSRTYASNPSDSLQSYPENLNFNDIFYFMWAPTLCYELNFPRSARVRKRFLVKRLLEMMFLSHLMVFLIQQWIIPTATLR